MKTKILTALLLVTIVSCAQDVCPKVTPKMRNELKRKVVHTPIVSLENLSGQTFTNHAEANRFFFRKIAEATNDLSFVALSNSIAGGK